MFRLIEIGAVNNADTFEGSGLAGYEDAASTWGSVERSSLSREQVQSLFAATSRSECGALIQKVYPNLSAIFIRNLDLHPPKFDRSTGIAMANRTVKGAVSVHGTNPQYHIHAPVRLRIYESKYWKENCTLLNSALVLERAVDDLKYIGGTHGGNVRPVPFLCLVCKLLQIQPKKEIIDLYINQPDFKYLRALGAFYLRCVGSAVEIYSKLEPIYRDYRKLRIMDSEHKFSVIYMDDLIDRLLHDQIMFNVTLPRVTQRIVLEQTGQLKPYKSELDELDLIPTNIIKERLDKKEPRREQPRDRRHYEYSSSTSSRMTADAQKGPSRFSRYEIDKENAIRAQLGLKPLRQ